MSYFFKKPQKLAEFIKEVKVTEHSWIAKGLYDQYLCLLSHESTAEQDEYEEADKTTLTVLPNYSLEFFMQQQPAKPAEPTKKDKKTEVPEFLFSSAATTFLVKDIFSSGVELFKQRSEQIQDFAFDNTASSNNIVVGLLN